MVNYSTNINKTNNHLSSKESLNSDGQQFYQYQQNKQSPLTYRKFTSHCDGQLFYQYQQNKQSPLT